MIKSYVVTNDAGVTITAQQKEILANRWAVYLGDVLIKSFDELPEAVKYVDELAARHNVKGEQVEQTLHHDDIQLAFKPLETYVRSMPDMTDEKFPTIMSVYMYMHHSPDGTHAYKHSDSRSYVYLSQDGVLQQGTVEGPLSY